MITETIYAWGSRHNIPEEALHELAKGLEFLNPSMPQLVRHPHTSEAGVQAAIRVEAAKRSIPLWRNNNGVAMDASGRHVRYGLGNDSKKINSVFKSSDLIGITPVRSTAADQVFGVFTAVEVKAPGWKGPKNDREQAQAKFLSFVKAKHGIALFAQSVADFKETIK